jgi:hypothetical protein
MTKVMTPQGIERETDDLFYWDGPKEISDEQSCRDSYMEGEKPEEFRNLIMRKTYEDWLKRNELVATGHIYTNAEWAVLEAQLDARKAPRK